MGLKNSKLTSYSHDIANQKFRMHREHRKPTMPNNDVEQQAGERTPLITGNGTTDSTDFSPSSTLWGSGDHSPVTGYPKQFVPGIWKLLSSTYVNGLLVLVPIGIVAGCIHANPSLVFLLNFIAIIPLAALLSFATEELAAVAGQTVGGLLNASFGNAIELIVSFPFFQNLNLLSNSHSGQHICLAQR